MQQPNLLQTQILVEPTAQQDAHAWVALDDVAEWSSFSQVNQNQQDEWESRLAIEGMHCAACAFKVEKALKAIPGVASAEVNATSGRARVVWSAAITKPSEWLSAVQLAGYRALPAADAFAQDARRKNQRLMLWRWLVAGFCMMQVMMYAYPSYVANTGEMTPDMLNLLRWASWLLTLPVLIFSSGPFFSNALNDIKQRQISMELPVAIGILITFLVSTAATFDPKGWWGSEVYFDSMTMFVFFLLTGRWLELRMRDRTAGALDALMHRLPASVELLKKDGSFERVGVRRLQIGDVVRVLPGESFPADGEIILGETSVDEALLTGESHAVSKKTGAMVIAGSHNLTSAVQMRINKLGQDTRYAQIVALMERVSVEKPRLALLADRIARPFLIAVLFAAAASAAFWWQADHSRALMSAVAVLIVTCPCALSLATPAAMLTASGALARSGVLVRKMQALEALTTIDTVVFDKTGTLTQASMAVGKIETALDMSAQRALQLAGAVAKYSLHPVSRALVLANNQVETDSDVHIISVQEVAGAGLIAQSSIGELRLGSAKFCGLDNKQAQHENNDVSKVFMSSEAGWLASFTLHEAIKSDAATAVSALKNSGLQVEVLSGDKSTSVAKIAALVGIAEVRGNCTPQDKLNHLKLLQQQGRKVAMIGDGLNDGPVLASAYVSIAIGQAVPLAQAQSDFVVMGGQLFLVPQLLLQAKHTMRVVKQNLLWAAIYNAVCVPLAVAGMLPAWLAGLGMALSSLLVILNAARLSKMPMPTLKQFA
ncbi:MAG TPA: cation-translocating P-type ATPase [Methylotenera sp.]|nr:cation-translocating P-type ATPase [Methylotenera sp.]HPH05364.1 cation-translocating P-type ATPase [Methylotenera sp.]HPN01290.1 cation-translocating P-type ATPase [Methylotenera sp.]